MTPTVIATRRRRPRAACSCSPRRRAAARRASCTRCSSASRASGCRSRTRRARRAPASRTASTTTSSTSATFMALKDAGEFLEHALRARQLVRDIGDLARREQVAGRARRAARDRLAGRGAGAPADPRMRCCIFILPPSLASLQGTAGKARPGHAGGDRAPARRRARGDAPLRRVRLCYYESGLCEGRRRSVRRSCAPRACAAPRQQVRHAALIAQLLNPYRSASYEVSPWPASPSKTVSPAFPTASS